MSINTGFGMPPVQAAKPAGMAEPPKTSPLFGSEPPKSTQMPGKPNDSNPFNVQDNSVGKTSSSLAGFAGENKTLKQTKEKDGKGRQTSLHASYPGGLPLVCLV